MTKRCLCIFGFAVFLVSAACIPASETNDGSAGDGSGPKENRAAAESSARFVDSTQVSPNRYRVLEAVSGVRLLAAQWPAGADDEPHSHPTSIWYALTDARLRVQIPGSPLLERRISAGDSGVQPPVLLHSVQNIGDQPAEILIFEIEPRASAQKGLPSGSAPRATSVSNRFRLLEQHAGYALILTTLEPGQRDRVHSHPPALWFALTAADLRVIKPGSAPVEVHLEAGASRPREAVEAHTVANLGTSDAKLLLLEAPF